jgi:hypothetical protein
MRGKDMDNDGKWYPPQDMGWVVIQNAAKETIQSIKELELACSQLTSYIHRSISELLQTSNEMLQAAEQGTNKHEAIQPEKLMNQVDNDIHSMEFSSYVPAIYLPVLHRQKKGKPSKVSSDTDIPMIKTSSNLRLNQ